MNELTERERELLALIRAEPQLALQLYEIVVEYKEKESEGKKRGN